MKSRERIEIEGAILSSWEKLWPFKLNDMVKKKVFSIDTPPPYINADLHIGHAAAYTYIDTTARVKRALGFEVIFPFGLDKNGLPIEVQAEKEFGIDIRKTDRETYVNACKKLLDKYKDKNRDVFRRLGFSFNDYNTSNEIGGAYETDSPEYRALGQAIFIKLWKEGKIYEDTQLVNYCTVCHTTLSDAEVEYEEKDIKLYKLSIKIDDKEFYIATTRPELLPACAAIAANPADTRYSHLKTAIMPITNKKVPLIFDEAIDPNFGTGLMMVCSYGDKADVELFRKHHLTERLIIDEHGKIKDAEKYSGLTIAQARAAIIEDLRTIGVVSEEKSIKTQKPVCWRSKNAVEIIREKELYLKQVELKQEALKMAREMEFHDEPSRQLLIDWINSVDRDWPISRTRYYGNEIPLWKCKKCGEYVVPETGKYYEPWRETPKGLTCTKCGGSELEGDRRIFDTWMDSSNSNLFIVGYGRKQSYFNHNFPVSLRPQGKEIVRTWLYYTLVKSILLTQKEPFVEVMITNHAVDENGEKFSKSKGNGIPIEKALNENGADVIRLWAYLGGNLIDGDIRYSKEKINEAERILTKISNIAKFVAIFGKDNTEMPKELSIFDKIFLNAFDALYNRVVSQYDNYAYFDALKEIKTFLIGIFADHYIELQKPAAYEGNKSVIYTLNYILKNSLELLNPIAPFLTEYLYNTLYSDDIKKRLFEKKEVTGDFSKDIVKICEFDSMIWSTKKSRGLALNGEISGIEIPKELSIYSEVLIRAHRLKQ